MLENLGLLLNINRYLISLFAGLCLLQSCTQNGTPAPTASFPQDEKPVDAVSGSPIPAPVSDQPDPIEVARRKYIDGEEFCAAYSNTTSNEYGVWVTVPKFYDQPEAGVLKIYAYTLAPFDPNKSSFITVDGGPGQNTHGMVRNFLKGEMNEIHFDQRGLGCSAPSSFDDYRDERIYSSLITVKDMDEIRKAYKIKAWTVYGISYGSIPATMYGSLFESRTNSVLLEGVSSSSMESHSMDYKAEKMNIVVRRLNEKQKTTFDKIMSTDVSTTRYILALFMNRFYMNAGMRNVLELLQKFIREDGSIDADALSAQKKSWSGTPSEKPVPQQRPGVVDYNFYQIIRCKDQNYAGLVVKDLGYTSTKGFFTLDRTAKANLKKVCDYRQIKDSEMTPYKDENYPIHKPVYYFQGSHDGATHAAGAFNHWKTVPKGASYFMLSQKGGHNPNVTRMSGRSSEALRESQASLFKKAILAEAISSEDLNLVNANLPEDQKWLLFTSVNQKNASIDQELQEISWRIKGFNSFE